MKFPYPFPAIAATVALMGAGLPAFAQHQDEGHRNRPHHERPERMERNEKDERVERVRVRLSLDRAIAMAESRYQARVVRAETHRNDGGVVYVLRMLNDAGRVWTVRINAGGNFE